MMVQEHIDQGVKECMIGMNKMIFIIIVIMLRFFLQNLQDSTKADLPHHLQEFFLDCLAIMSGGALSATMITIQLLTGGNQSMIGMLLWQL